MGKELPQEISAFELDFKPRLGKELNEDNNGNPVFEGEDLTPGQIRTIDRVYGTMPDGEPLNWDNLPPGVKVLGDPLPKAFARSHSLPSK